MTLERLLEVARRRLTSKSLADVITRQVAGSAQLAHGTLFKDFATKKDLALALCRQSLDPGGGRLLPKPHGQRVPGGGAFRARRRRPAAAGPCRTWAGELLGAAFRPGVAAPEPAHADE